MSCMRTPVLAGLLVLTTAMAPVASAEPEAVGIPEAIPAAATGSWWWRSQEHVMGDPEHFERARRFRVEAEEGSCVVAPHGPDCPPPCESLDDRVRTATSVVVGVVEAVGEGFGGGVVGSPVALLGVRVEETLRGVPRAAGSELFVRYPNADFVLEGTRFRSVACDNRCRPAVGERIVLFLHEGFFYEDLRLLVPVSEMLAFAWDDPGERCASGVSDLEAFIGRIRSLGRALAPTP